MINYYRYGCGQPRERKVEKKESPLTTYILMFILLVLILNWIFGVI